ncbi:MAG: DUF4419 domain-containing protein, partial [Cyanobacteria bacterium HKST-UBA02]|nr:DUF4419 domain-containing protein [Cyanobacteria bacterium HKST-UBA02]
MPKTIQDPASISFRVHDVEPASEPLPERLTVAVLERLLQHQSMSPEEDQTILSCSDYNCKSVDEVYNNPLFSAVHLAYAGHRPLVLSPDMIWIAVVQGFAQHINNNPEKYRHRFVSHEGKLLVTASVPGLDARSPESDWGAGIEALAREVETIIGERFASLSCDFTTSGAIEKLACQVALLDTFQNYFTLVLFSGCGIPSVTLLGEASDWALLVRKLDLLEGFDLDWWLPAVREIADNLWQTAMGSPDLSFWQNICKDEEVYAGTRINGWIVKLFPYLKDSLTGCCTVRNPLLFDDVFGFGSDSLPSGISQVPFYFADLRTGEVFEMEMLSGFFGVQQDPADRSLRPRLGWAVRHAPASSRIISGLKKDCLVAPPLEPAELSEQLK